LKKPLRKGNITLRKVNSAMTDCRKEMEQGVMLLATEIAKQVWGMTPSDAWEKGICIQCHKNALEGCYSKAGIKEYTISALCERCFDEITCKGEEEDIEENDSNKPAF
jgi:hypothetical protein